MVNFKKKEEMLGKYVLVDKGASLYVYNAKKNTVETMDRRAILNDLTIKNYILDSNTGKVIWSIGVQDSNKLCVNQFLTVIHTGRGKYEMLVYNANEKQIKAIAYPDAYLENRYGIFVDKGDKKRYIEMQPVLDDAVIVFATYRQIENLMLGTVHQLLDSTGTKIEHWSNCADDLKELLGDHLATIAPRRFKPVEITQFGVIFAVTPKFAEGCKTRLEIVKRISDAFENYNWEDDEEKLELVDTLMTIALTNTQGQARGVV